MKYIKVKGNLLDVLGESAKRMETIGVRFLPQHQMIDVGVSYGTIIDEGKFNITHEAITIFNTVEEVNADIDIEYDVKFLLTDINKLTLDIELSGGVGAVVGYDANKALDSQENLLALLNRDMAGITINRKADYLTV